MRCRIRTGSLVLTYIGLICLIASASPALANDLQIADFTRDINKNGAFFGSGGTLWYSPSTDTISADFVLAASWDCVDQAGECVDDRPSFQALISVQSALCDSCDPASSFELGNVNFLPADVRFRPPGSGNQQKAFFMTISGGGFEAWASQQFDQGNRFYVTVELDPAHQVSEDDIDNNFLALSSPDFVPLNNTLSFGPTPTALDGLTDLQEDGLVCGTSSGASGGEANFSLNGSATWTPSSNGLWNEVSVPLSNLCAEYMLNGDGFDLASLDSVGVGPVNGQLGGHDVTVNSSTLDPTKGAVPGAATIPLPAGHSFHSEDPDIGGPLARGSATMTLTGVTPEDPADYNTLVANGEVSSNGDIGYLHAQGLPFSMRVYEMTLSSAGINGAYNRIHHLHRRVYSFGPPFVINRDGPTSNDWRFGDPAPSQADNSFELLPTGLTVPNIDFAGRSNAVTHYPRTRVTNWQAFSISIVGGQLVDGQAIGNGATYPTYHFDMSADCAGCPSQIGGAGNDYGLTPSIPEGLSSDGAVITRVQGLIDPAWGPYAPSPDQNIFQRRGDSVLPGILYFPGSIALGTKANGNVGLYLMGMRQAEDSNGALLPTNHYPLDSINTSRRGNHFMAGLTLGPQYYSLGPNKQPSIGEGVDLALAGTSTDIVFGGAQATNFENVASAQGTKYVVRRGGLTGAFNTATPPQPSVYGYPLTLQRFAFTQVNNILDDYTWIDGTISIPGKGGFNIVFESLDLLCSGDVSGGLIAREGRPGDEACNNDPEDDNGNGFIDENCKESLAAWNAKIDLLTMAFVPDNPNLGFCAAQNRTLEVGNTVHLKALDGPIGMLAKWSHLGEPLNAQITGNTDQVVDRRENMGFDVALDSGIALKTKQGDPMVGWFAMDGEVGLPFWNRLDVSIRLANENVDTQDQTIVMEKGGTLTGNDDNYSNDYLKSKMKAPDVSSTFEARYEWGATGFDFELPVYYEAGRYSNGKPPRFLGHTWSDDLVVLQANAGIDFITQQETKVSFGASADFKALETVSIDLNVDVSDPDSVAEIDAFLNSPLNISGSPVNTLISGIKSGMNQLNKVTDAGLDSFLEQGVTAAMAPISGQFEAAANVIGKVQSVPDQLASVVAEDLRALTEGIINPLSDTLDTAMMDVYNELPVLFYDIYIYGTPPDISKLEDYATNLEKVKIAIDNAVSRIADISDEVAAAKAHVTALKNDLIGDVDDALTEIGQLKTDLGNTGLNNCDFDGANPLLGQIKEVISRLQTLRSALDSVNLLGFGQKIGQAAGVDLGSLSAANNAVHTLAQELAGRVNQAQTTLVGPPGLCSNGPFVTQLNQILNTANNFLTALQGIMGSIETQMSAVETQLHSNLDAVQDQLNDAYSDVQGAKSYLDTLIGYINEAKESFPNQLPFLVATVAGIQSEMDQTMSAFTGDTYTYQWSYTSHSFVREMANTLRNFIDAAIATAAVPNSNLADLVTIVPHPTPTALRTLIVDEIMNNQAVETLDTLAYQTLGELLSDVNNTGLKVFDQMNFALQEIIKKFEEKANQALEMASGVVPSMPVAGARMDGYALMVGDELERLHIGAEWAMSGDADESSTTYNAALDVTSWNANNKAANCGGGIDDLSGLLDAVISSTSLPITIGTSGATIKELYLGFTLDNLAPVGIFGGISLDGEIDFQAFQLYDIAFAGGVGKYEMYLGASGGALFDNIQLKLAFLVGKTCNTDVLFSLDPQAAQYITFPNNGFAGIYARGSASFPVWDNGCVLQLGVGADVGGWLLIGPPFTVGALLGGGAFGKGLCIASLRGQITLRAEKVGFDLDLDSVNLGGQGWGAAGLGFCDPGSWSTLARSRDDDWCGTGDVIIEATYNLDDGFDIIDVDASAIH